MKSQLVRVALTIMLLLAFIPAGQSMAQSGSGYDLTWSTIDSGGGIAAGGVYALNGTIGQADAGNLSGGGYTLSGGFWVGTAATTMNYHVYLPLVLR